MARFCLRATLSHGNEHVRNRTLKLKQLHQILPSLFKLLIMRDFHFNGNCKWTYVVKIKGCKQKVSIFLWILIKKKNNSKTGTGGFRHRRCNNNFTMVNLE